MDDFLVSIIVPVYNTADYIDKCLTSLVRQTYRNIEIVCINDGSTDGSGKKLNVWAHRDQRIRVLHLSNGGVSRARNVGLDIANGEYIGFVDSDDWVEKDTYEIMLREMIKHESEVCVGGYTKEGDVDEGLVLNVGKKQIFSPADAMKHMFSHKKHEKLFLWELCDKLFKRDVIGKIRLNTDIAVAEDKLILWEIMKNAHSLIYLPLKKYHYVMRNNSACHSITIKNIKDINYVNEYLYGDNYYEDIQLRKMCKFQYLSALISGAKTILNSYVHDDINNFLMRNRKIIRNNIVFILGSSMFSLRCKLGAIYLLLPLRICQKLVFLTRKN